MIRTRSRPLTASLAALLVVGMATAAVAQTGPPPGQAAPVVPQPLPSPAVPLPAPSAPPTTSPTPAPAPPGAQTPTSPAMPAPSTATPPTPSVTDPRPTAADPMAPRPMLAPPPGIKPFPTPPQILDREIGLDEALALALDNQPQIRSRLAAYQAARFRVWQAMAPILPQVSMAWNVFRNQSVSSVTDQAGPTSGEPSWNTTTSAGIRLEQRLWDFGKTYAATDAARFNADSSQQDIEITRDNFIFSVKQAYFDQLLASRLVVVNEQALDRAQLNLRSARGFFDVGTRPKSDVTRAEVDVANGRVALIQAQNAVSVARIALNTAMGVAINAPTRVRDILAFEQFPTDRNTLVGEALARRPEYRQAKARFDAADAVVRQTFRDFFPEVFGSGRAGAERADMNPSWTVGLELRWTMFDGGGKIARYKEAQANRDAAQSFLRETELSLWQQVEQAFVSLLEAEERIGAAQKAVESAQENFRLNQGRFDAGVGTILELTTSQVDLANAQATEARALRDYRVAISALERALSRRP